LPQGATVKGSFVINGHMFHSEQIRGHPPPINGHDCAHLFPIDMI
jgi:hypothetical protein